MSREAFKHVTPPIAREPLFPPEVGTLQDATGWLKEVVAGTQDISNPATLEAVQVVLDDLIASPGETVSIRQAWGITELKKKIPGTRMVLTTSFHYDSSESELPEYMNTKFTEETWDGYESPRYEATYTLGDSPVDHTSVYDHFRPKSPIRRFVNAYDLQQDPNFTGYNEDLAEGVRWTIANLLTLREIGWVEPGVKDTTLSSNYSLAQN